MEGGGGEVCEEVIVEMPGLGSIILPVLRCRYGPVYQGRGGNVRNRVVAYMLISDRSLLAGPLRCRYRSMQSIASNMSI